MRVNTDDVRFMRQALGLARRGYGQTSPNPMVGAVLVKGGRVIGQGWHHRAGEPHAEIEALRKAAARHLCVAGATLYVTLEPCCTSGRTPPCTDAIVAAGLGRVVVAATDSNPSHAGRGFTILEQAGLRVTPGVLGEEATRLNEAFNHWILHRTPFVTVKAAMTLDGKIATATGESKWITSEKARARGMHLRRGADAILVGVNTVLADDPALTVRWEGMGKAKTRWRQPRRIILDSLARTPLSARVVSDEFAPWTTVVVTAAAPGRRVAALAKSVNIWVAPARQGHVSLRWLLTRLGREQVSSLLVEGGGEVNGSFLEQGLGGRIEFFYAPKILGGRAARRGVAGEGRARLEDGLALKEVEWGRAGQDLWLSAVLDNSILSG